MNIRADLPSEITGLNYSSSHHHIELTDDQGNKTKLAVTGIVVGKCLDCLANVVALTNMGDMICTHCRGQVKWAWTKPQFSLIPEKDSDFLGAK